MAPDCITDQPLISTGDDSLTREVMLGENSCGACRGFLFAMLFNVFLAVSRVALWLLLRK
jgi:hypothetical protein